MIKIGLTGGIGSGKSSVGKWFKDKGIHVIDSDRIVHDVLKKDKIIAEVKEKFGEQYIQQGQIDRRLLGGLIFGNAMKKKILEEIIHPEVLAEMMRIKDDLEKKGERLAIFEIPLLYEVGWEGYFDEVWVVYVPAEIQQERIMERNGFSAEEAEKRISSQIPLSSKKERADVVVDNSKQWAETEKQLQLIWKSHNW